MGFLGNLFESEAERKRRLAETRKNNIKAVSLFLGVIVSVIGIIKVVKSPDEVKQVSVGLGHEMAVNFNISEDEETVMAAADDYTPVSNMIYWDENKIFHIDYDLFGLNYDEVCNKLNIDLSKPEVWKYWGTDLYFSHCESFDKQQVVFMFQDEKLVMIYNDQEIQYDDNLRNAIVNYFGADENAEITGENCSYSVNTEEKYGLRQQYVSNNMR